MKRRQFITVAAGATAFGLAGCLGDSDADTSSPEGVIESWYTLYEDVDDEDEYIDAARDLLHSESPWHGMFDLAEEFDEEGDEDIEEVELERLDVEVVQENLDASDIQGRMELFFQAEEGAIEAVAASDNALVEAEVEFSDGEIEQSEHVVAEEGGEWLIFV